MPATSTTNAPTGGIPPSLPVEIDELLAQHR